MLNLISFILMMVCIWFDLVELNSKDLDFNKCWARYTIWVFLVMLVANTFVLSGAIK